MSRSRYREPLQALHSLLEDARVKCERLWQERQRLEAQHTEAMEWFRNIQYAIDSLTPAPAGVPSNPETKP